MLSLWQQQERQWERAQRLEISKARPSERREGLRSGSAGLSLRRHEGPWPHRSRRARGAQRQPRRAGTLQAALPALPDGVAHTPDADAVGELPHSHPLARVPDAAALLQRGRRSARHPRVPRLRSLPESLRLLAGCLALPQPPPQPPPPCLPRHRCPGTGQVAAPGTCHLKENREASCSFFFFSGEGLLSD